MIFDHFQVFEYDSRSRKMTPAMNLDYTPAGFAVYSSSFRPTPPSYVITANNFGVTETDFSNPDR